MTRNEQEKVEKVLNEITREGYSRDAWKKTPQAIRLIKEVLNMESMITSILAYNWGNVLGRRRQTAEELLEWELKRYHSYLKEYVLIFGQDAVINCIQDQMDKIQEIKEGTFEDSEGVTYNTIIWKN